MKYVIYARVSDRGSDFEGETSIPMQVSYCREWVKFHGGTVTGEYSDEFFTGANTERPGLKAMWQELESHKAKWDAIIVYKLSRLSRSQRDSVNLMAELFAQNKGLVSATENLDFSTPSGRAMLGMMQVFNQFEREQTAENTRAKMTSIARSGLWPVGRPPFGYRRGEKKDNKLYVDPINSAIVKSIFEAYVSNTPMRTIRKTYKSSLSLSAIYTLLRNRTYLGKIIYDGREYQGQHEPIVSQALFARAQDTLPDITRGREYSPRPKAQRYDYLLTGLIYCQCGSHLTPSSAKSGEYHYYTCRNIDCEKISIKAEMVEKEALDCIMHTNIPDSLIQRIGEKVKERHERFLESTEGELLQLRSSLAAVERKKNDVLALLLNNAGKEIPESILILAKEETKKLEKVEKDTRKALDELEGQRANCSSDYMAMLQYSASLNEFARQIKTSQLDRLALRQLIRANIKRIDYIGKDDNGKEAFEIETLIKSSSNSEKWHPILKVFVPDFLRFKIA